MGSPSPTPRTRALLGILGYEGLFPPQEEALRAGVERGASVLVTTPTASGKTLIALIAIVNRVRPGRRAFYTAPLRSIAREKYSEFGALESMGYTVGLSIGDLNEGDPRGDVVITTYEKLDSMIRNNPELARDVDVFVIDEVHYLSDASRGPLLESLVAKMLYMRDDLQVVGLSATVPNAEELASWLNAKLVNTSWRPVPLVEGVFKSHRIHYADGRVRDVARVSGYGDVDLVIDAGREGGQSLVFSQSRRRVVYLARRASGFGDRMNYDRGLAREGAREVLSTGGPRSLREELASAISSGVAFHHAGLSNEQRKIVEDLFRGGGVAAIYATPTLAAGVNLPARRVVVEEYYRFEAGFRSPISVAEYKQLAGRAGRPGLDPVGEAIIIASSRDSVKEVLENYVESPPESVESKLGGIRGLRHSILGVVASGLAESLPHVVSIHMKTLYAVQRPRNFVEELIRRGVRDLIRWGLLESRGSSIRATHLGRLVSSLYIDPETVPIVRSISGRLRRVGELELLFIVGMSPDMQPLRVTRKEEELLVDRLLGDSMDLVESVEWLGPRELMALKIAYLLKDWIEEASEDTLYEQYNVGPGDLASITETARWISYSLSRIGPLLGLPQEAARACSVLEARIRYGVKEELLPLVSIPNIGRVRARRLYRAGYRSREDLARADPRSLASIPGLGPRIVRGIMEHLGRRVERLPEEPSGGAIEDYME